MNQSNEYQGLRFTRPRQLTLSKRIVIGGGLLVFTVLWWLVPHDALYWLLLAMFGILLWVASFGWRQALAALHDLLHRLEQL